MIIDIDVIPSRSSEDTIVDGTDGTTQAARSTSSSSNSKTPAAATRRSQTGLHPTPTPTQHDLTSSSAYTAATAEIHPKRQSPGVSQKTELLLYGFSGALSIALFVTTLVSPWFLAAYILVIAPTLIFLHHVAVLTLSLRRGNSVFYSIVSITIICLLAFLLLAGWVLALLAAPAISIEEFSFRIRGPAYFSQVALAVVEMSILWALFGINVTRREQLSIRHRQFHQSRYERLAKTPQLLLLGISIALSFIVFVLSFLTNTATNSHHLLSVAPSLIMLHQGILIFMNYKHVNGPKVLFSVTNITSTCLLAVLLFSGVIISLVSIGTAGNAFHFVSGVLLSAAILGVIEMVLLCYLFAINVIRRQAEFALAFEKDGAIALV